MLKIILPLLFLCLTITLVYPQRRYYYRNNKRNPRIGQNSRNTGSSERGSYLDRVCLQKSQRGYCNDELPRWFYNSQIRTCERFVYSGCGGNLNSFKTKFECSSTCGRPCSQPKYRRNCNVITKRYFYNKKSARCEPFKYRGCGKKYDNNCGVFKHSDCGGKANSFLNKKECEAHCGFTRNACVLPPKAGSCKTMMPRYFYDKDTGECEVFMYGGCGGNSNNFKNKDSCLARCGYSGNVCMLPSDTGPCKGKMPRYYYNKDTERCEMFIYGGCDGNDNNFIIKKYCEAQCGFSSNMCLLPPETGKCKGKKRRYYYNKDTRKCERFIYSGCGGNANNFRRKKICKIECDFGDNMKGL